MNQKLFTTLFFLCAMALSGCEPEVAPLRTFQIKKGEHYATTRVVETLQDSKLTFEAKFNSSAKYDLGDVALQSSKNKLMGFSDCNSLHHENSARFAWQWYNNRLEIYAYCYVNTERIEKFIGVVNLDEFNTYEISISETYYTFTLNHGQSILVERGNVCRAGLFYMLWPYFGGSQPAPHDIAIEVKRHY